MKNKEMRKILKKRGSKMLAVMLASATILGTAVPAMAAEDTAMVQTEAVAAPVEQNTEAGNEAQTEAAAAPAEQNTEAGNEAQTEAAAAPVEQNAEAGNGAQTEAAAAPAEQNAGAGNGTQTEANMIPQEELNLLAEFVQYSESASTSQSEVTIDRENGTEEIATEEVTWINDQGDLYALTSEDYQMVEQNVQDPASSDSDVKTTTEENADNVSEEFAQYCDSMTEIHRNMTLDEGELKTEGLETTINYENMDNEITKTTEYYVSEQLGCNHEEREARRKESEKKGEESKRKAWEQINPLDIPEEKKSDFTKAAEKIARYTDPYNAAIDDTLKKVLENDGVGADENRLLRDLARTGFNYAAGDWMPGLGTLKKFGGLVAQVGKLKDSDNVGDIVLQSALTVNKAADVAISSIPVVGPTLVTAKNVVVDTFSYSIKKLGSLFGIG